MSGDAAAPEPLRWQDATIARRIAQTPRVVSLFLRTAIERHDAGQHVDVRPTAPDGYQAQRSYSIAPAPNAPSLELAIERLDDGEVSPYFHDVAQLSGARPELGYSLGQPAPRRGTRVG